jgi:hypothetical protein
LLPRLGKHAHLYEVCPVPNGSVGLEMLQGEREILLNISEKGEIAYVVALGDEVHRGRGIRCDDAGITRIRRIINDLIKDVGASMV